MVIAPISILLLLSVLELAGFSTGTCWLKRRKQEKHHSRSSAVKTCSVLNGGATLARDGKRSPAELTFSIPLYGICRLLITVFICLRAWCQRDGLAVLSAYCSLRGLEFSSQHPHGGSKRPVTPDMGDTRPCPHLWRHLRSYAHNDPLVQVHIIISKKKIKHRTSKNKSKNKTCLTHVVPWFIKVSQGGANYLATTHFMLFMHFLETP